MAEAGKTLPTNLRYLRDSPVIPEVMRTAATFDLPLYVEAFKLNLLRYVSTGSGLSTCSCRSTCSGVSTCSSLYTCMYARQYLLLMIQLLSNICSVFDGHNII